MFFFDFYVYHVPAFCFPAYTHGAEGIKSFFFFFPAQPMQEKLRFLKMRDIKNNWLLRFRKFFLKKYDPHLCVDELVLFHYISSFYFRGKPLIKPLVREGGAVMGFRAANPQFIHGQCTSITFQKLKLNFALILKMFFENLKTSTFPSMFPNDV